MMSQTMRDILSSLKTGCTLEIIKVSKALSPNGQRYVLLDPHAGTKDPVDPRSVRALLLRGFLAMEHPKLFTLTSVGRAYE